MKPHCRLSDHLDESLVIKLLFFAYPGLSPSECFTFFLITTKIYQLELQK